MREVDPVDLFLIETKINNDRLQVILCWLEFFFFILFFMLVARAGWLFAGVQS